MNTKLINKKFTWSFLKTLLPITLSFLVNATVPIVDNLMVSKLNNTDNPIAALVIASEILFFVQSFFIGGSLLSQIFLSQFFGAKKIDKFKETFKISIIFSALFSIILFFIIKYLKHDIIMIFNNKDKEIIKLAKEYLDVMSYMVIITSIFITLLIAFISMNKGYVFLISALTLLIFNIVFNYVFMYIFTFGVKGAAYSSILSGLVTIIIIFWFLFINRKYTAIGWKIYKIDFKILKDMFKKSLIVTGFVVSTFSFVALTAVFTRVYGKDVNAALGIAYAINGVIFSILPAMNQTSKTIIGSLLGQSKFSKAKMSSKRILVITSFICLIISLICFATAFIVPQKLLNSPISIKHARWMISVFAITGSLYCITTAAFSIVEAGGKTIASTIFQNYFQTFIILPIIILFALFVNIDFIWIFFISQIIQIIPFFISIYSFRRYKWLNNITKMH